MSVSYQYQLPTIQCLTNFGCQQSSVLPISAAKNPVSYLFATQDQFHRTINYRCFPTMCSSTIVKHFNDDLCAFMRYEHNGSRGQIHKALYTCCANQMFGTANSRFTAVMFKNSSNISYSILFLNKHYNI